MDKHFDCERMFRLLSEYIDKEIDSFMKEIMEEHLRECERCLLLLHSIEKTIDIYRKTHKKKKVPENLVNRIYYEIRVRYKR